MVTSGHRDRYWIVATDPTTDPDIPRHKSADDAMQAMVMQWMTTTTRIWRIETTSFGIRAVDDTFSWLDIGTLCRVIIRYGAGGVVAGVRYYRDDQAGDAYVDFNDLKSCGVSAVMYRVGAEVEGRSRMPRYRRGWDDQS